ncbi:MAG: endonuclease/exonuclease/phosphatase family protein [Clostridia bacterium]|nr:endonuclease/exonuclease/phosphatase family protein [Clostridia bacterium]
MTIATWNTERLKHYRQMDEITSVCNRTGADILVLTEADKRIDLPYRSRVESAQLPTPFYGETERRVIVFSNYPVVERFSTYDDQTSVCVELETENGDIIVYGTIIGVFGNRNAEFRTGLIKQTEDFKLFNGMGKTFCVTGDFNVSFSDNWYFTHDGRKKLLDTFYNNKLSLVTKHLSNCIYHVAVSADFIENATVLTEEFNCDRRLSDHKGTVVTIEQDRKSAFRKD